MKNRFVSNVSLGTGNNFILLRDKDMHIKSRVYLRVEDFGRYTWKFYFQNTVDSTFAFGDTAYRNRSGGEWKILNAQIGYVDFSNDIDISKPIKNVTKVTFGGSGEKNVSPDERFWSDETEFEIPSYSYLVWEWELYGNGIPCTPDSQAATYTADLDGDGMFRFIQECPMPALLGCDRNVKGVVAFIGDSITQGCGTNNNRYEMWAHKIAQHLGKDYSVWNLGLGYGRGSDAATDGAWLNKAKMADIVVMTVGVNDLLGGVYTPGEVSGHPNTADEIIAWQEKILSALKEAGCRLIISTTPPFEYNDSQLEYWRKINRNVKNLAEKYGAEIYDIEYALDADKNLGNVYTYGAHPDGNGGTVAADYFRETFYKNGKWFD